MLKETAGVAGGVVLFSPLGMPFVLHGVAGVLVGAFGLRVADSVLKQVVDGMDRPAAESDSLKDAPSQGIGEAAEPSVRLS